MSARFGFMTAVAALSSIKQSAVSQTFTSKNVIIFVGDGMGPNQVEATKCYLDKQSLSFELLGGSSGEMTTENVMGGTPDSAAAGTAMATGTKVKNGVISVDWIQGKGPPLVQELKTALEYAKDEEKSTGLVTTVSITDATPASWAAHERSRYWVRNIATDYLEQTKPNVLFGSVWNGINKQDALDAGYHVVENKEEMDALENSLPGTVDLFSGQFGSRQLPYEAYDWDEAYPHLSEMTTKAIDLLSADDNGFFLLAEGGLIDWLCHDNDMTGLVHEMIEFEKAVKVAVDFAVDTETLIVVAADHETGGLENVVCKDAGEIPEHQWTSRDHTLTNVPFYLNKGTTEEQLIDNTDIFHLSFL